MAKTVIMYKFFGRLLSSVSVEKTVICCVHADIYSRGHNLHPTAYCRGTINNRDVSGDLETICIPTSGIFKLDFDPTL